MTDHAMAITAENTVRGVELGELEETSAKGRTLIEENNELIRNIKVRLSVCVGGCQLTIQELLDLKEEQILTLDKNTREPVDITVDGKLVARGHLVAVDDSFGVRISEIVSA